MALGREQLVLFRDGTGAVGALRDRCPHRGMRLSRGTVVAGRLTCPYHGWSFCRDGHAASPAIRSLKLEAEGFEAAETDGFVWIRARGGSDALPRAGEDGLSYVHSLSRDIEAELPAVMDNFTEVEHTGIAHWQFGYDPERLDEIEVETAAESDIVRVTTRGPQRPLLATSRLGFGIPNGMTLVCEWETLFNPPRSTWRWHWIAPSTGEPVGRRFKAIAYFVHIAPARTRLLTYYYWSSAPIDDYGFAVVAKPLIRLATRYEVGLDAALVEGLVAGGKGVSPRANNRFDEGLVLQRERLAAVSSGRDP